MAGPAVSLIFDGATVGDLGEAIRQLSANVTQQRADQERLLGMLQQQSAEVHRISNENALLQQQLANQQGYTTVDYVGGAIGAHEHDQTAHEGRISSLEQNVENVRASLPHLIHHEVGAALARAESNLTGILNAIVQEVVIKIQEVEVSVMNLQSSMESTSNDVRSLAPQLRAAAAAAATAHPAGGVDPAVALTVQQLQEDQKALLKELEDLRAKALSRPAHQSSVKGAMADAKRCSQIGKLGAQGVEYDPWIDSVEALVAEKYPEGEIWLTWAKLRGPEPVDSEAIADKCAAAALNEEEVEYLNRDLWGLLQQQSAGQVYQSIKPCKGKGIDAWRRIHNVCNPKNAGAAETIRAQLIRERPAKNLKELQAALVANDNLMEQYEVVATKPLTDEVKLLAIRAVLPAELLLKIDTDQAVPRENYKELRKYVEGYLTRAIAAQRRDATGGTVPMDMGSMGATDPLQEEDPWTTVTGKRSAKPQATSEPAFLQSVCERLEKVADRMVTPPGLSAVGVGKGAGTNFPNNDGKCFLCGGDHLRRDCPKLQHGGQGGGKGKGKDGKGKGKDSFKGGRPRRQGWGICNAFRKFGQCNKMNCPWAHGKVPSALSGCEGLVLEDLGNCNYDPSTGVYTPVGLDDKKMQSIAETVKQEMSAIEAELGELNGEFSFEEDAPRVASGFTRQL